MTFDAMCVSELRPDGQRQALLVDGLSSGIPMVVSGGLLLAGGITLAAWPARREAGRGELRPAATSAGTTRLGLPWVSGLGPSGPSRRLAVPVCGLCRNGYVP